MRRERSFGLLVAGFTMVELLIVVGIVLLLSGGGLATFLNARDRRQVLSDARLVEQELRTAQRRALAGEKPSECGAFPMEGYQVAILADHIEASAVCPGGSPPVKWVDMTSSTLSSSVGTYTFGILKGGAVAGTIDVCQAAAGKYLYRLAVNVTGSVEAPAAISQTCTP